MRGLFARVICLLVIAWGSSGALLAETRVTTQNLRLTFDDRGNLDSAIACFPACSGEQVRLQQFADEGLVRVN